MLIDDSFYLLLKGRSLTERCSGTSVASYGMLWLPSSMSVMSSSLGMWCQCEHTMKWNKMTCLVWSLLLLMSSMSDIMGQVQWLLNGYTVQTLESQPERRDVPCPNDEMNIEIQYILFHCFIFILIYCILLGPERILHPITRCNFKSINVYFAQKCHSSGNPSMFLFSNMLDFFSHARNGCLNIYQCYQCYQYLCCIHYSLVIYSFSYHAFHSIHHSMHIRLSMLVFFSFQYFFTCTCF